MLKHLPANVKEIYEICRDYCKRNNIDPNWVDLVFRSYEYSSRCIDFSSTSEAIIFDGQCAFLMMPHGDPGVARIMAKVLEQSENVRKDEAEVFFKNEFAIDIKFYMKVCEYLNYCMIEKGIDVEDLPVEIFNPFDIELRDCSWMGFAVVYPPMFAPIALVCSYIFLKKTERRFGRNEKIHFSVELPLAVKLSDNLDIKSFEKVRKKGDRHKFLHSIILRDVKPMGKCYCGRSLRMCLWNHSMNVTKLGRFWYPWSVNGKIGLGEMSEWTI